MSEEIKEPRTDREEPLEQQSKTECQSEIPSEEVATENLSEGTPSPVSEEERLRTELEKLRDTHLRLVAEYDNYRKRTLKEKSELIRSGGEKALGDLLPVVDDLDIALQNLDKATDLEALKEGMHLIHSKFLDYLMRQGVHPIETAGDSRGYRHLPCPRVSSDGQYHRLRQEGLYTPRQGTAPRLRRRRPVTRSKSKE